MGAPRSVRLPAPLEQDLEREFARRGVKEWSAGIVDLLSEAVRGPFPPLFSPTRGVPRPGGGE